MSTKTQPAETLPVKLSLLDIEVGWLELLQRREEAEEKSADRPTCGSCAGRGEGCPVCQGAGRMKSDREMAIEESDVAIAEHLEREVMKVDGTIGFCRFLEAVVATAKAERDRQALRASRADALLSQVKAGAKYAIERAGKKRVDGNRGYLLVKGNGGLAPLVISDESLLPAEVVKMEGWIRGDIWAKVVGALPIDDGCGWALKPRGSDGLLRAKLAEPCGVCEGSGGFTERNPGRMSTGALQAGAAEEFVQCVACGGTGKAAVPGAYLADRGNHLEVKA